MIYDLFMESEEMNYFIQESSLKTDIIDHDITNMINAYRVQTFLENGEEDEVLSEKRKSIKNAVLDKIQKILQSISSIIEGFFQGITQLGSGEHLTPEDYMNSEAAQIRLDEDIFEKKMAIDEEYLKLRKIVSKISNVSHIPPELVAMVSDASNNILHENRFKIANAGKSMIKAEAASKLANGIVDKMKLVKKDKEKVDECIRILKDRNTPIDPKDLTKLQKISKALHNTSISYLGCYNKLTVKVRKKNIAKDYYDKTNTRQQRMQEKQHRKESKHEAFSKVKGKAFDVKDKVFKKKG